MAHLRPRRRHAALAFPVGLALTASIGFLPGTASAAGPAAKAPQAKVRADGPLLSYVVNTGTARATLDQVKKAVGSNGGSIVESYDKIGVIVVHSKNPDFAKALRAVPGVESAGATRTAPITPAATTDVGKPEKLKLSKANALAAAKTAKPGKEPLESLQWDMAAIKADKAAKINPGSRKVTVGVIDTGVDDTHPDLAPNFSRAQSASCVTGKADTSAGAWRPYNPKTDYHGTHVAGTIAAARNGIGVTGVAPNTKVSAIKVSTKTGSFFYAESVVCAFVFAADHGIAVTNNSYYVDPWMFNCANDADQKAIADAVGRATAYADRKGVVNVASAGNSNFDLASKKITDKSSPNDTKPGSRDIDPSTCLDVPAQLPGVVTVSATGVNSLKSYYSNYGQGVIDVAAPGGDVLQVPDAPAKDGRILSTMPGGDYAYLQGTSMAGPHVAGVAALLKATHPKSNAAEIQWILKAQAKNPGCPVKAPADAPCVGTKNINSHYGYGIVDALAAVKN
ncbi:S8 family serine peptidase [Streptomyces mobaraensis NBRC 13819 = DSM 40847]|uniref:S8 family serine peptidase n=2 Tax=Streptomyces mobaraensis TaxID=35621 RepID=A0A5N5W5S3_STRMB|nr:S8 family serine peptidase [Streptomyces mobaraensis]EME98201.1 putative ssp-like protease [Streptomyces mobaraensis NBRC 13819 = DSM 40847]KAB7843239.1 S8 family serine peptidase [Streptomyces mobaraensis]QTT73200.1 S8 family serine peptidase [Streptomyces mobaraensis NBRC 13819 = DSM 40847]